MPRLPRRRAPLPVAPIYAAFVAGRLREPAADGEPAGVMVSLHGAGVEATSQARSYTQKPDVHVVAPTNRRPFGFDWEDWGRRDACEVLADFARSTPVDSARIWLTGHSMGGHGTWQLGVHFPDRFAAIAPSAGWRDFRTYGGAATFDDPDPVTARLDRAANASRTLQLTRNLAARGVYVLHGDQDRSVPVRETRAMRDLLGNVHPDFAYDERPGAGHWCGRDCLEPGERRITLTTDNVARLRLDLRDWAATRRDDQPVLAGGESPQLSVDEAELELPWPEDGVLALARRADGGCRRFHRRVRRRRVRACGQSDASALSGAELEVAASHRSVRLAWRPLRTGRSSAIVPVEGRGRRGGGGVGGVRGEPACRRWAPEPPSCFLRAAHQPRRVHRSRLAERLQPVEAQLAQLRQTARDEIAAPVPPGDRIPLGRDSVSLPGLLLFACL